MKHKPLRRRLRATTGTQLLCVGGVLLALAGGALAQAPAQGVWVEPRVSVGVTLSSNGQQSSSNPKSEQSLEVRPGVRVQVNSPRVRGFMDYSLAGLYYAQHTSGANIQQSLNANARLDLWQQRAYLDMSGVISQEAVSAFGNGLSDGNRSETANFRFSPSFRGQLGVAVDYEVHYGLQAIRSEGNSRSDLMLQDMGLRLHSMQAGQRLGWSVDASAQSSDYTQGRDTRADSVRAAFIVTLSPQLLATLSAGVESNDVLTVARKRYNTTGLDLEWRPSDRSRLQVGVEDRYFGQGHHLSYEYRTGLTIWRYADNRGVSNSRIQSSSASLGSIYDLLDAMYSTVETDPVLRAQLIESELLKLGLPADAEVFQSYLTSSATVDRAQAFSVALKGRRSVVTLAISRSVARRLDSVLNLGDDFDTNTRIEQRGWSLNLAHRLNPMVSVSAQLSNSRNSGSSGAEIRSRVLSLGLSSLLGLRTSGSLQWRRTVQDSSSSPYRDTAVSGLLTHRF